MKDYAEAIAAYDMAIANDDRDVVSYVYRGESQILSGNLPAGLADLEKVLQIDGQLPHSSQPGCSALSCSCSSLLLPQLAKAFAACAPAPPPRGAGSGPTPTPKARQSSG
jgi:tetratricopeptide (TPR) repeat protein